MAFKITYRQDGEDIKTCTYPGQDKEAAIASAGVCLILKKYESARIRDLDGSTAEICSVRPDDQGGYVRDDKP
jgi:hypothetical protein